MIAVDEKNDLKVDVDTPGGGPRSGMIHEINRTKYHGMVIGKIASAFHRVRAGTKIRDLAEALLENENIFALGVVDEADRVTGIVVRRDLFDILGKPFGRDLYTNKTVEKVMKPAVRFDAATNIFAVAEELAGTLNASVIGYYVLTGGDDVFAGVFSSKDLLICLSEMTRTDIELARRLQAGMVREEFMEGSPRFAVVGASSMAKGVGGDYYSIRRYDGVRRLLAVCDVSGKGIAASLVTAIIDGMLSIYDFSGGLRHFIIRLNEYIALTFQSERFVTGVFADFDEHSGEVVLYDLGHSYIFVYRDGRLSKITTKDDNIPLGIQRDILPRSARFALQRDDLLIIITDGIIEQLNPGGEQYGIKRLAGKIQEFRHKGLKRIKDELFADIAGFRGREVQHDDMTMILLEYRH